MMSERRTYSRRSILMGGAVTAAAALVPSILMERPDNMHEILGKYQALTIAHNAALTPEKFHRALESTAPHIEVDLTLADGKPVVAHAPEDYLALPDRLKPLQDPYFILRKIVKAKKYPFLDLKDEITDLGEIRDVTSTLYDNKSAMASSNNHDLLLQLRQDGFKGKILFSIGSREVLSHFIQTTQERNFSDDNYGVSIRHSLLWDQEVPKVLKRSGFSIAAWSPNSPTSIAQAVKNGADIITSDNFDSLALLNESSPF